MGTRIGREGASEMADKLRALHPAVPPPLDPGYQPAAGGIRSLRSSEFMNWGGGGRAGLPFFHRLRRGRCVLAGILFGTMASDRGA